MDTPHNNGKQWQQTNKKTTKQTSEQTSKHWDIIGIYARDQQGYKGEKHNGSIIEMYQQSWKNLTMMEMSMKGIQWDM